MIGAFQGIDAAHSQLALDAFFRGSDVHARTRGESTFRSVAVAVSSGRADVGIMPIDNAIAGTIRDGYDLLLEFDLVPIAEIVRRMDHRLLGVPGATLEDVREILAHPLVLAECGRFLASLPAARAIPCEDTGIAAREVARGGDASKAAIAPPQAATLYALSELAPQVADHPENFTRFVVFRARASTSALTALEEPGPRKSSCVLVTANASGSLSRALSTLAAHGIGIAKIESKPQLGAPEHAEFYLDVEGDLCAEGNRDALDALRACTVDVRVIGSYRACATINVAQSLPSLAQPVAPERPAYVPSTISSATPKVAREARPHGTRVRIGHVDIGDGTFTIVAGPCSVESREQVTQTAFAVRDGGAVLLRGGAFKPRTNPYAFQGLGWDGVALLAEAGRATGMPTVSECMSIDQAQRMARDVDMLQIGARNMQNYDLLRAVGRTGRPVLLKRGLSATLDELLAAAEYILAEGNPNVILCERGIRTFETATRNTLDLSAVPVLRERTHLPIFVDPSHGVGVRRWIGPLCRAAKAVGAHGIMIEVHPRPSEALSDKDQALTFDDFLEVTRDLERVPTFTEVATPA